MALKIHVIYADKSEWVGFADEWSNSPDSGVLHVMIYYDRPYRLSLAGHDFYAVRDELDQVTVSAWSDFMPLGEQWIIQKNDLTSQGYTRFKKADTPIDMIVREGRQVDDVLFKEAHDIHMVADKWQ